MATRSKIYPNPPATGGVGGGQTEAQVRSIVSDWAEAGNTDDIPVGKLTNAPGGGSGLTESEVDDRVQAGVEDWAEDGNSDLIPATKLTNAPGLSESAVDDRVEAGVADWAEDGNADLIPAAKLANAPSGGGGDAASLSGNTTEHLFNNFSGEADAGTTLPPISDTSANWSPNGHTNVDLGRVIAADDDSTDLRVSIELQVTFPTGSTPVNQVRRSEFIIPAKLFRLSVLNAETTGDAQVDGWVQPMPLVNDSGVNGLDNNHTRMMMITRGRTSEGNDRLRIIYAGHPVGGGDSLYDTTAIYVHARLEPRPDSISVSGESDVAVEDWAKTGNSDLIPADKLTNAPSGSTVLFYSPMMNKSDFTGSDFDSTGYAPMEIANSDILINQGGWTVTSSAGVSSIVVPEDGFYQIHIHIFLNGSAGRNVGQARISRTRGSDTVHGLIGTGSYLRGSGTFSGDSSSISFQQPWSLEEDDALTLRIVTVSGISTDLDGSQSWLSVTKI